MKETVEIDGSYGEGGGQVLRTALTLSTLTGRPTRVVNVRAGRKNPGLAPQHLTGVLALAKICDAEVQGAALESTEIVFTPRSGPCAGDYTFDVTQAAKRGSAGSVTLIFQTLVIPLAFAASPSHLTLKGGTHVPWSPPYDYLADVFLPTAARMGLRAECRLDAWGFYPTGGGQMAADIHPLRGPGAKPTVGAPPPDLAKAPGVDGAARKLTPLTILERGEPKRVWGVAVACNLKSRIAQQMANRAHNVLTRAGLKAEILPRRERGAGPGAGLFLAVEYENCLAGFSAFGSRGKPSEQVAEEACRELLEHHDSGAPVAAHLADQLLLPMALADGRSEFRTSRISKHLLTSAHIIGQFIPAQISIARDAGGPAQKPVARGAGSSANIDVGAVEGEPGVVTVEGAGGF